MTFTPPPARAMIAVFLFLLALAIMTPGSEDGLLAPEPRVPLRKRFTAWLFRRRRFRMWPDNNNDPDQFVAELQGDQPSLAPVDVSAPDVMLEPRPQRGRHRAPKVAVRRASPQVLRVSELPSAQSRPKPAPPDGQLPPWDLPAAPVNPHPDQPEHHDDAPTIVRGMRAIMASDPDGIGHYLDGLPGYNDET